MQKQQIENNSVKKKNYYTTEAKKELFVYLRLSSILALLLLIWLHFIGFGLISILVLVFLIGFLVKFFFYFFVFIYSRYRKERAVVKNIFEQRLKELSKDQKCMRLVRFGKSFDFIYRDKASDVEKLDKVLCDSKKFVDGFDAFKRDCSEEYETIASEIMEAEIKGIELSGDDEISVYFDGLPGELFTARFNFSGEWELEI